MPASCSFDDILTSVLSADLNSHTHIVVFKCSFLGYSIIRMPLLIYGQGEVMTNQAFVGPERYMVNILLEGVAVYRD